MIELELFGAFFLIGIAAYGGGVAAITLIEHELVITRNWFTAVEMSELIAVSQMTPGPIAINTATFLGYRMGGVSGAFVSTLAVITPSVLLCTLIVLFFLFLKRAGLLERIHSAVAPAVLGLILAAVIIYFRSAVTDFSGLGIAVVTFSALFFKRTRMHPVFLIFLGGLAGVVLFGDGPLLSAFISVG